MTYRFENGWVFLEFKYNPNIVRSIKVSFIEPSFNTITKEWRFKETESNLDSLLDLINLYGFTEKGVEPIKLDDIKLFTEEQLSTTQSKIDAFGFKLKPRHYQVEGITSMIVNKKLLNGSAVGLGKTGQCIVGIEIEDMFPALVVTPASVKYNWAKEWEKWVDGREVSVIDGKNVDFNKDVVVINYDILKKHEKELKKIPWKVVVADESQMIKNGKSMRTKAFKRITRKIEYKFLLSGTAIMNRPRELQEPLKILGVYDSVFGGWKEFIFRYCNAYYGNYGLDDSGASNTLELNKRLRGCCYIRYESSDVLSELPEYVENFIEVPFDKKKEHKEAIKSISDYIRKTTDDDEKVENAENHPQLILPNVLKRISIESKIVYIKSWLSDFKENGEKLVVFGKRVAPLEELSKHFGCMLINGSTSSKNKLEFIEEFQKNDDPFLFGNIQSLGTGIDGLQNVSNNILFIELPDRPSDLEQAIGRLKRSGQKNVVNVNYIFAKGSVDKLMFGIIEDKKVVTDAVNAGKNINSRGYLDMNMEIYNRLKR